MPLPLRYILIGAGAGLVLVGFFFLRWAQQAEDLREEGSASEEPTGPVWIEGWSSVRRSAVGLACLIAGYHFVAYGADPWVNLIRVPPDQAWLLVVGLAIGVMAPTIADGASAATCGSCGARLGRAGDRCARCGSTNDARETGSG